MELSDRGRRAAIQLLEHLSQHPEATDASEGIHQWWLREPEDLSPDDLSEAVSCLLQAGLVRSFESSPGLRLLGASREFLDDPQAALERLRGTGAGGVG